MSTVASKSSSKEVRELYELKQKASLYYAQNGVPQKMEDVLNTMFYDDPNDVYGYLAEYFGQFAKAPKITKIVARRGVDTRAQSTIQTEVYCRLKNKDKLVITSVSSNPSPDVQETARPEEKEEEEKEKEEFNKAAISYLNSDVNNRLQGISPVNQEEIDDIVSKLFADLKTVEDERLAREAAEKLAAGEEISSEDKKLDSATSKPKSPKNDIAKESKGTRGKGGAKVPVVLLPPSEPREKMVPGSNCMSAISQALCAAGAKVQDIDLFEHMAILRFGQAPDKYYLPIPMVTILHSGRAAPGKSNCVKEFMIVPRPGKPLEETLPQITAVYNQITKVVTTKNGTTAKNVTDTGAIVVSFDRPEQGLDMIQEAITAVGLTPGEDIYIALNCAGHEIFEYEKGKYEVITGQQKVPDDLVEYWAELLGRYMSVIAIIDPMRKQEAVHWMNLCEKISERCFIIGSHVYQRPGKLKDEELTDNFRSSGIVLKLEQMNTITDIMACSKKMEDAGNKVILAASQGETTDDFLADMAVGMNATFLKLGAPCRGERVSKLNRLLQIEEILKREDKLAQHEDFKFPVITPPPPPVTEEWEEAQPEETKKNESGKKK
ncbi:hypothetical protein CHS0354_006138 [Potamilus streckersoni]|uniref:Enolase 4 n=1 Tax=Potamilus streckersoni TaxID=2493646 RepID=A0AAE0W2E1_9BIVA|nr:hypothetical protein CHS0354_006138 [Potamilus streckersoni]